jgi:hypothetical protein
MTNYLPRINTTLNDLGLKVSPPPAGPKVTLLGVTSNTGITVNEPYTVSSVEKAINSLYFDAITGVTNTGRYPGELALAMEEAVNGGAPNIEVMVIAHKTGLELAEYLNPSLDPTARYTDLSGAYEILRSRDLDVVVPVGVYGDTFFTGATEYSFGKQLADFCFQSTQENNSCVGVMPVRPPLKWGVRSPKRTRCCWHRLLWRASDSVWNSDGNPN